MAVYDPDALAVHFHQVFLRKAGDVVIMVPLNPVEIGYLFEIVDDVFGVEVAEMYHHVHRTRDVDQRIGQFADAADVGVRYYAYSHDDFT